MGFGGLSAGGELFSNILNSIQAPVFITDSEVRIFFSNIQGHTPMSWTPKLQIKNGCGDLLHCAYAIRNKCECGNTVHCPDCFIRKAVKATYFEEKVVKTKSWMPVVRNEQEQNLLLLATTAPIKYRNNPYVLLVIEDISDMFGSEYLGYDKFLTDKAVSLEEQKLELQENIAVNITEKVIPTINNLKKTKTDSQQDEYLDFLEATIREIASPFYKTLSGKYFGLTPMEVQVADLIRIGKTSKEIGIFLDTSVRAIEAHRHKIRKKIGICNKKASLKRALSKIN